MQQGGCSHGVCQQRRTIHSTGRRVQSQLLLRSKHKKCTSWPAMKALSKHTPAPNNDLLQVPLFHRPQCVSGWHDHCETQSPTTCTTYLIHIPCQRQLCRSAGCKKGITAGLISRLWKKSIWFATLWCQRLRIKGKLVSWLRTGFGRFLQRLGSSLPYLAPAKGSTVIYQVYWFTVLCFSLKLWLKVY